MINEFKIKPIPIINNNQTFVKCLTIIFFDIFFSSLPYQAWNKGILLLLLYLIMFFCKSSRKKKIKKESGMNHSLFNR
ncbi:hypothetical protein BPUM_2557 [Bacillus pumilus SAFR-032]|uniref:Uncharacterized protein n=1 Tax=Bacillus pumilus (strain SAFR-032) TaxID=315750 RepID=A8FG50_BACP2|nr:hypothetical protein BPUM_2557 [Bacillus pumilus SAFR-032]